MRQLVSIAALALAVCGLALGQSSSTSKGNDNLEWELMQLERDWSAAYLEHDTATVERIVAEDYIGTDGRGVMTDKTQEIEDARGPKQEDPEPDFLILDDTVTDMKVRRYSNVGVVTGRSIEIVKVRGKETTLQYRRTTVWVKRQGRWQCVAFHGSRILEPPKQ